jgi:hypothetical protein
MFFHSHLCFEIEINQLSCFRRDKLCFINESVDSDKCVESDRTWSNEMQYNVMQRNEMNFRWMLSRRRPTGKKKNEWMSWHGIPNRITPMLWDLGRSNCDIVDELIAADRWIIRFEIKVFLKLNAKEEKEIYIVKKSRVPGLIDWLWKVSNWKWIVQLLTQHTASPSLSIEHWFLWVWLNGLCIIVTLRCRDFCDTLQRKEQRTKNKRPHSMFFFSESRFYYGQSPPRMKINGTRKVSVPIIIVSICDGHILSYDISILMKVNYTTTVWMDQLFCANIRFLKISFMSQPPSNNEVQHCRCWLRCCRWSKSDFDIRSRIFKRFEQWDVLKTRFWKDTRTAIFQMENSGKAGYW